MTDDMKPSVGEHGTPPSKTLAERFDAVKMRYWLLLGFLVPFAAGFGISSGETSDRVWAGLAVATPLFIVMAVFLPALLLGLVSALRAVAKDIPSGDWRSWRPLNVALAVVFYVVVPVTLVLVFVAPDRAVDYAEAGNHVGEEREVCGPVIDVESTTTEDGDDLTFVNVGEPYPDRDGFTFAVNGSPFVESDLPDDYVCAEGEVRRFEGRPQMFVAPGDLRFPAVESPDELTCPDPRFCY